MELDHYVFPKDHEYRGKRQEARPTRRVEMPKSWVDVREERPAPILSAVPAARLTQLDPGRGRELCWAARLSDGPCACTRPACVKAHAARREKEEKRAKDWTAPIPKTDRELDHLVRIWRWTPIDEDHARWMKDASAYARARAEEIREEAFLAASSAAFATATWWGDHSRTRETSRPIVRIPHELTKEEHELATRMIDNAPVRLGMNRDERDQQAWLELLAPSAKAAKKITPSTDIGTRVRRAIGRAEKAITPRPHEQSTGRIEKYAA